MQLFSSFTLSFVMFSSYLTLYIWCFCVGLAAVREIKGGWRGGVNFLAKRLIKTLFKKKVDEKNKVKGKSYIHIIVKFLKQLHQK